MRARTTLLQVYVDEQGQTHGQAPQAVQVKAWAKVNLALNILARRPDGYHDIETVMHRIGLADDVEVVKGGDVAVAGMSAITVKVTGVAGVDVSGVPCDLGNVAFRAAQAFLECLECPGSGCPVSISIRKRIPVGAGLGGGSADAAAVLMAMNELWGEPYGWRQLMAIAASIGADVPFCLMNHDRAGRDAGGSAPVNAAFAEGVGDRLTPLPGLRGVGLLLVTPGYVVSTPDAYAMWDARIAEDAGSGGPATAVRQSDPAREPDRVRPVTARTARMLAEALSLARSRAKCADAGDDLRRVCSLMSNDFESLIDERYGLIAQMKQLMMQAGAMGALMSGSGPTVFGVYGSPAQATEAAEVLRSLVADCGFDVDRYGFSVIDACIGDSRS
jgi:4-diphosphocytidyl-2-C-methyl-D-erythritol kinase